MGNISKWFKTKYPGVRYREHPERKFGIGYDKYYTLQYRVGKTVKNEGLGWASEGMKAEEAARILGELKRAQTIGEGPKTLEEKRQIDQAKNEAQRAEEEQRAKEAVTFGQVFTESYFPLANYKSKRTQEREEGLFRIWLAPVIGNLPLKDISPFHLERVKQNMIEAGKAPRSINYALAVTRLIFNFAKNHNLHMGESPTNKVKKPPENNKRIRFLTHEEADKLLTTLAAKSSEVYEMALLSLHCGLRAGEIFSLTWGCVDVERGIITLLDPKNKKTRSAFMTSDIKAMFQTKVRGGHNESVWPGKTGEKIQSVSKTFARTVEELGLNRGITDRRQRLVFHSLRHSFASWMVESGIDLYRVEKLLGQSSLAMMERYSHLGENALQSAVKQFEQRLLESSQKVEVLEVRR